MNMEIKKGKWRQRFGMEACTVYGEWRHEYGDKEKIDQYSTILFNRWAANTRLGELLLTALMN